jgi:hypothetical protein
VVYRLQRAGAAGVDANRITLGPVGETLNVLLGRGGWLRLLGTEGAVILVRVAEERPGGRFAVVEVHVVASPATGELLRSVPLAALDAVVNGPRIADEVRLSIAAGDPTEDLDWSTLVPESRFPSRGAAVQTWHGKDPAEPGVHLAVDGAAYSDGVAAISADMPARTRDFKLKVPGGRKRPDSFYRRVAELYTLAAAHNAGPAVLLAKANGVPVTTVHRWIREARARGILPSGKSRPALEPEGGGEVDVRGVAEVIDALEDRLEQTGKVDAKQTKGQ